MSNQFTNPYTTNGNPILLDQLETHLTPFCKFMCMKFFNYESVPSEDQGMLEYIVDNTVREIAANMSGTAIDWKNEYSITIYNRAILYNKQQNISH